MGKIAKFAKAKMKSAPAAPPARAVTAAKSAPPIIQPPPDENEVAMAAPPVNMTPAIRTASIKTQRTPIKD